MKKQNRFLSIILLVSIALSVVIMTCSCGTSSDNTTSGTTSGEDQALASFLADSPVFNEARITGMQSEVWDMPITSYELIGDMYYLPDLREHLAFVTKLFAGIGICLA